MNTSNNSMWKVRGGEGMGGNGRVEGSEKVYTMWRVATNKSNVQK
jgi:hypothetical protein